MKQTVRFLVFIVSILLVASSWAEFKDFKGAPHKLTEFTGKGKWTIVMIWASDCRVCNAEIGQYIQFHEDHKDKDASILGVSMDGQVKLEAARDFIHRHAVTFPNLLAEPNEIANLYENLTSNEWLGTPSFLVYNPNGQLMAAQAGAVPSDLIEKFIKENSKATSKAE